MVSLPPRNPGLPPCSCSSKGRGSLSIRMVRMHLKTNLHVALDNIKGSDRHMGETTSCNASHSASSVVGGGKELNSAGSHHGLPVKSQSDAERSVRGLRNGDTTERGGGGFAPFTRQGCELTGGG